MLRLLQTAMTLREMSRQCRHGMLTAGAVRSCGLLCRPTICRRRFHIAAMCRCKSAAFRASSSSHPLADSALGGCELFCCAARMSLHRAPCEIRLPSAELIRAVAAMRVLPSS